MRGIRFNSLSVSNFRGINDAVRFDFSSPLTVVYAPNGTGKTTMCEAAEWLLTGQVERLRESNGFDLSVLSSKFPSQDDTTVSTAADLYIDGMQRLVRRTVGSEGSSATISAEEGETVDLRPSEFLGQLAPAGATDDANPNTAINLRQRWLKGTRFLSSEALAALVDTDEKTIERRTEVFADLLGIRHLLDAERQCDKYIAELGRRLRNITSMTESRSTEIVDLEIALGPDGVDGSAHFNSARMEADSATKLFAREDIQWFEEQVNLDERLASLTALHRRQKHGLDARLDAAKRVEAKWNIRSSLEMNVADGISLEDALTQSLALIEKDGREATNELADYTFQKNSAYKFSQALAKAKDELSHLSAVVLSTLLESNFAEDTSLSLAELSQKYPEHKWPASARHQRRQELKSLELASARLEYDNARLAALDVMIAAARANAPSREELERLHYDAAQADADAKAATKLLDAVANPVARLQAAARELLGHDHGVDVDKCPLCSHNWGAPEELRSAIEATLSASPELIMAARSGADVADDAARLANDELDEALKLQSNLEDLEKEYSELELVTSTQLREQERLGIEKNATAEDFISLGARLDVAEAIFELLEARNKISPTVFGSEFQLPVSGYRVADLLRKL